MASSSSASSATKPTKKTGSACLVASIDVGRNNMCVCIYAPFTRTVIHWKNYNLQLKAYDPQTYRKTVETIFYKIPKCTVYLIEKQVPMAPKNCLIESILHCIVSYAACKPARTVSPTDVRKFFLLRHDKKYYKKRDAVFVTTQVLEDIQGAAIKFRNEADRTTFLKPPKGLKRDDLADSLLQALFYSETTLFRRQAFRPSAYKHYTGRAPAKPKAPKKKAPPTKQIDLTGSSSDEEEI